VAANSIRWLGHSTVLIELDGIRLLTDPLLRRRVATLRRASPLDVEGLEALDAVLISHVHYDHLDVASLRKLGRDTTVAVPTGAGKVVSRLGFAAVKEVSAGDTLMMGPVSVSAVHAEHGSSRLSVRSTAALGYIVTGSSRIYFLGDTDLFPGMETAAGDVDVALIPIWGWGPSLGTGHLDPRSAAEALNRIRPRLAVPIHWGTYFPAMSRPSHREFLHTPPEEFLRAAAEIAPDLEVRVLAPGESLPLEEAL
jgi:L-ascorbate metabolism protein UlaG (beta-lactamase superfamily)